MNNFHVLIPCAGTGSRFGADVPKQYYKLLDKTVLDWTLEAFIGLLDKYINSITVVYSLGNQLIDEYITRYPQVNFIANGGDSRAQTVINGLSVLKKDTSENDWVLVHDAARSVINTVDILTLIKHANNANIGCILASKATDTIKQVLDDKKINKTIDRNTIYMAQTPQLFKIHELYNALSKCDLDIVTDEASAIELMGGEVQIVESKYPNFKITYLQDIKFAEIILQARKLQGDLNV